MNEAFDANTEEGRRLLLVEAEQVVMGALEQYSQEIDRIHFIQISDHITYKLESNNGESFLLRIHTETLAPDEIRSELTWLEALAHEGITVPLGMKNLQDEYVTEVVTDKGRHWLVTMLRWIEGDHEAGEISENQVKQMGSLMARLHKASQDFVSPNGFKRQTWGVARFEQDFAHLQKHYRAFLSDEDFELYQQAAGKVIRHLGELQPSPNHFGMIHADFHEGNLVFNEGKPYLIDFGRCGFGYYLYDMAEAFIGLHPLQRQRFVEAYRDIVQLEDDAEAQLETFFIKALIENQSFHAANPREKEELLGQKRYSLALIRHYLSGELFLFNRISM
ncbi:phosphotransferase enzyme family protein [Paenibacillus pini]|uniref:Aminoglycoside phosphotransferase domain-containing protein n=1 Tax=Paenibacillus pini JCM 16418 TaxID=1236976 RepID=W7Z2L4_9BACL|nr:phosphotransferase [Paenibacillus pini]GAF08664.1 hypothetical protein JCM16418_2751 [Paenibacillus pini JCM 16418]